MFDRENRENFCLAKISRYTVKCYTPRCEIKDPRKPLTTWPFGRPGFEIDRNQCQQPVSIASLTLQLYRGGHQLKHPAIAIALQVIIIDGKTHVLQQTFSSEISSQKFPHNRDFLHLVRKTQSGNIGAVRAFYSPALHFRCHKKSDPGGSHPL